MQCKFRIADYNRMAGICSAAVTHHYVILIGKDINDLALALIAPLQTYNAGIHNISSQKQTVTVRKISRYGTNLCFKNY
jgi:hypothetical protein